MKILNAYYMQHHTFCLVPRHVREDMEWMAGVGTNAITLAVLEQDLFANKANMDIICREADRAGIAVHAVPSRWGGLLAGAPKVASLFTATHPETWVLKEDGTPYYYDTVCGPMSSVHHPATFEFYCESLTKLLSQWPIAGIVLDEPKTLDLVDRSPAAKKVIPADAGLEAHIDAGALFFDRVGAYARQLRPGIVISLFLQAFVEGYELERCARITALDYFGCDGRPWRPTDGSQLRGNKKALIGQAERFLSAARANGRGGLILVENISMPPEYNEVMDEHLPTVLSYNPEHLLYYYYGMNLEDPDGTMEVMAGHLRKLSNRS